MAKALYCPNCNQQLPKNATATCPYCSHSIPAWTEPTKDPSQQQDPSLQQDLSQEQELLQDTLEYGISKPTDRRLNLEFGNYELLGELGRGGMGVVYKARQKRADRLVALKVMRDHDQVSGEEKERFTTEVRALARVSHPNIVTIFEVGEEDGCPFFTMEYVDGYSLAHRNRDQPMSAADAARLIEQLAGAVHAAHAVGVLHRDIKPGNVLIDVQGQPKLTDFGLAKHLDQDSGLTLEGSALGTPAFMSPEQASGDLEKVGPTSDVYSLGATLYDLQTGQPPFRGETAGATLARVLKDDVVPPSKLRPGLSPELEAVCLKCLEKNPAHRYPTANELEEELRRWRNGDATKVRPWSWRRRLLRRMRRYWKFIIAMLFFVITVVAFVYLLILSNPEFRERRAMMTVDRAIKSGDRVELVGTKGPPKWLRTVVDIDATVSSDPDRVFQVKANDAALIQLAPAAHHDQYKISCEIRTRTSFASDSSSGIYFAHNQAESESTDFAERFLVFRYFRNLQDATANSSFVNVHDFMLFSQGGVSRLNSPSTYASSNYTINRLAMAEEWRLLSLEVKSDAMYAFWTEPDGSRTLVGIPNRARNTVAPILTQYLVEDTALRDKELDSRGLNSVAKRIEFTPRGAFGLFVKSAVVDIRNVFYEPLPDGHKNP